jgi:hypothetical protein
MPPVVELMLWFPVYALATLRITGLITLDEITRPVRDAVTIATDQRPLLKPLGYLVQCPWCVSVWVGAGVAAAAWSWHGHPALGWSIMALAFAQLAGMLSGVGRS